MNIRAATPRDIAAIAAIYARSVVEETASFELEPPDEEEMLARMKALREGGFPYLVAERDGNVLGYGYAGPYRTRPAYSHTVENTVYVAPQAQRQGVGSALLGALIEQCKLQGFRQMIAVIGGADHSASIALHDAAGFNKVGMLREVGHKHGRWLDVVLMQRSLL